MSDLKEFKDYAKILPPSIIEEIQQAKLGKTKLKAALEKLKEEYLASCVAPGECVGLVAAESIGEPGTQMSTSYDTEVIVRIGKRVMIVKIGELIDELIELKGSYKISEESEIVPLHDIELYVPSLNKNEKIEWKRVIECSRHKAPRKLMRIRTASGREIVCTDNHSFVIRKDNEIVPIKGSELKFGDRLPVINNFVLEKGHYRESLRISDFINDEFAYVENGVLCKKGRSKPIKNVIPLDWNSGWFIGAYLAEGYGNEHYVGISNIDEGYIQRVKKFAERVGVDYADKIELGAYGPSRTLAIYSTFLGKFISAICGSCSKEKKVPEFAFSANDSFVAGLLQGYFDGDGNMHVDRKMIRVCSSSKKLIDGIALLLSRFRIFSFKVKDKKGFHWLIIPYKYAPIFLAKIGSSIPSKIAALEKLVEMAKKFWNEKSCDYTDMISGFGDLFYRTAKKLGYPTRYVNNFTKRQRIGRTTLFRYMKLFEKLAKEKNIDIKEELTIMRRMFYSDVIWDKIEEIEYIDTEHRYVYDFSVPGLETFTTREGIITHNTLNTFHFAGVAEMSVAIGLPRIIEILDGRKEIQTPMMEIYLKSPYNKGKDIKKIALSIRETKLGQLAKEFDVDVGRMVVEISIDKEKMRDLEISLGTIIKAVKKQVKVGSVKESERGLEIKLKKEAGLLELYKLKDKMKNVFIKGIKGIKQVLVVKRGDEYIIITAGSNLKEILRMPEVDEKRTITNDIHEIAAVLGIEAAREAIINEVMKVMESQGLNVDIRHIMLVADMMCATGKIKGITRYGVVSEKASVLARASFETPIKHLINAALIGEEDKLSSVVENVMVNQPVPIGTGLPGLVTKLK
ncbi:DNA-directed RNA polymerase subunit A'' [Candidatus Woesearchaeota archaeon]|nr:DNA-directed RNA polymerase subunit A'' [Candidatus Woesearchaeota archaeon]RLE40554.1 MAG: DNA-directed RNA polymerase subunit A'' [Candidatus Woesearchaeota archaeon]